MLRDHLSEDAFEQGQIVRAEINVRRDTTTHGCDATALRGFKQARSGGPPLYLSSPRPEPVQNGPLASGRLQLNKLSHLSLKNASAHSAIVRTPEHRPHIVANDRLLLQHSIDRGFCRVDRAFQISPREAEGIFSNVAFMRSVGIHLIFLPP